MRFAGRTRRVSQRLAMLSVVVAALSCDDSTGPGQRADTSPGLPLPAFSEVPIETTGFSTTDIPVLPLLPTGGFSAVGMNAINENNWVVGTANSRAVLWRGGEIEVIWGIEPRTTRGFGINDQGMVVGEWVGSSGASLGFFWQDGMASPTLMTAPPGKFNRAEARDVDEAGNILLYYERNSICADGPNIIDASAIMRPPYEVASDYELVRGPECENDISGQAVDNGVVLGALSTRFSTATTAGAFQWSSGQTAEIIGSWVPRDFSGQYAAGTRADGMGGTVAVRWNGGAPVDLGTLGGSSSSGFGVNSLGWVVGSAQTASGDLHAFLWTPDQGMIDLGTLGGATSRAGDVNDRGYIVGEARNELGQLVPVIWSFSPNEPPDIQEIDSPEVTVGEELVVTPVVSDAEDDPFTLTWSGDVPANADVNGNFTWTPTADQVGDHTVTVTATQNDNPGLSDSETFVISVLPVPVIDADLQVTIGPVTPQQQLVGDAVAYTASIHNVGPDAETAQLTVALEYRDQAEWGSVPSEADINHVFFIEVGPIAAGETVDVPFEVVYGAFGVQAVTASVRGKSVGETEKNLDDNESVFDQVIDLAFSTPGVQTGGLDIPGALIADGVGLAIVGVHIPSTLIAGDPGRDLFLPSDLTPASLIPGDNVGVPSDRFVSGAFFVPADLFVAGNHAFTGDGVAPGDILVAADHLLDGRIVIPALNQWDPIGRLLFAHGNTDLSVDDRANTTLSVGKGAGPGLRIDGAGGDASAALGLCNAGFRARLGDGDGAEFACGSLTTTVLTGEVSVVLEDGTVVDIAAGAEVKITEDGAGGFQIEILAGDPDDVVVTPPLTNSPPVSAPGGPYVVAVGQPLTLDGTGSSDPDGDALTWDWILDDGSAGGITADGPTPTVAAPLTANLYVLSLTVTDAHGATSSATVEVAVYDPDRSSVTGGGWFDSPAGALISDPAAQGKANFAFHVAYRKGRTTPDGHARLSFTAGNLRLESELFDWLVVGGDMARFRGVGTLEGHAEPVRFEVVARDPDRIRVRIWTDAGDIYDSTEVSVAGGRIVIRS